MTTASDAKAEDARLKRYGLGWAERGSVLRCAKCGSLIRLHDHLGAKVALQAYWWHCKMHGCNVRGKHARLGPKGPQVDARPPRRAKEPDAMELLAMEFDDEEDDDFPDFFDVGSRRRRRVR